MGFHNLTRSRLLILIAGVVLLSGVVGCGHIPVVGRFDTDSTFRGHADVAATVSAQVQGPIEVQIPTVTDPGPMAAVPVRSGGAGGRGTRVALVEVDGLLLNQAPTGPYSAGENPVAAFRERLDAIAADPSVRAIVIRINSPGGSVTACDIMAEDLRRFRERSGLPVVCCLMDLGTSGAYYLAVGADRIVAHPTTVTGGIGALINRYNLQDAMAQFNILAEPITSGPLVNMGNVAEPLSDDAARLLQDMADRFAERFGRRILEYRPHLGDDARDLLADGRVVPADEALTLGLVDRLGYLDDAIAEAEARAGIPESGAEVVLLKRPGDPARSVYSVTPNRPIQGELFPISYPGLDRAKLPTFLYIWAPDPTLLSIGSP
ncbi:S49 family peptidase [Tautonia marina]|uniref:S49 family peptidase n=1 Tax=Tautonia marina TaxID=2653855 RepID=UPI00126049EC|nr:S49 family peptidase [Tautonia marina]